MTRDIARILLSANLQIKGVKDKRKRRHVRGKKPPTTFDLE